MTHHLACRQSAKSNLIWSQIQENEDIVQLMRALCHSQERLQKSGYTVDQLSREKLLEKLRCEHCAKPIFPPPKKISKTPNSSTLLRDGQLQVAADQNGASNQSHSNELCTYHPLDISRGAYNCCGTPIFTLKDKGCFTAPSHTIHPRHPKFLEEYWQYHATAVSAIGGPSKYRTAVVIDCEFGINKYGESELIRLSAIDFFTKQVLIDELVIPMIRMKHYNTKYSGIRKYDIDNARTTCTGLFGRDRAREALLQHVGPDTMLIVHGGSGDLNSLRLIHTKIIDTFVLDSMLFELTEGGRGLKNLCKQLLGVDVQVGKFGHDSVEDSLACRELFLCQLEYLPENYAERILLVDHDIIGIEVGKQRSVIEHSEEAKDEAKELLVDI